MKPYWTQATTEHLRQYQLADYDKRNEIFEQHLLPALDKLAECWINMSSNYAPIHLDKLKLQTISHLVGYLDKLDCDKKPFAYLTLTAKHFVFIQSTKQHKSDHEFDSLNNSDPDEDGGRNLEAKIIPPEDPDELALVDFDELKKELLTYWTPEKLKVALDVYCSKRKYRSNQRTQLRKQTIRALHFLGSPYYHEYRGYIDGAKTVRISNAMETLQCLREMSRAEILPRFLKEL